MNQRRGGVTMSLSIGTVALIPKRHCDTACSDGEEVMTTQTNLLLASVAALLLATGAAHAYPPRYYDCGKAFVKIQTDEGSAPSGRRVFPTTWIIQENWEKE